MVVLEQFISPNFSYLYQSSPKSCQCLSSCSWCSSRCLTSSTFPATTWCTRPCRSWSWGPSTRTCRPVPAWSSRDSTRRASRTCGSRARSLLTLRSTAWAQVLSSLASSWVGHKDGACMNTNVLNSQRAWLLHGHKKLYYKLLFLIFVLINILKTSGPNKLNYI